MRSIRKALGAAALALVALVATACESAPPTPTETHAYSVWHWNVAGSALHHGRTDTGLIDEVIASITARRPDFMSFNEICQGQYEAIRDRLAASGQWARADDHARFAVTRAAGTGICQGKAFGNALISSHDLGASTEYPLPPDYTKDDKAKAEAAGRGIEDRKMLCAPLKEQPRMKFCTVHITGTNRSLPDPSRGGPPKKVNGQQLNEVGRILDSFAAAKEAYLVAGDFNAQPDLKKYVRLAPLMAKHTELDGDDADHCPGYGEWTALPPREVSGSPACGPHAKIDLIIARGKLAKGSYAADAWNIPSDCKAVTPDHQLHQPVIQVNCSDHRVITGHARVQVPTGG